MSDDVKACPHCGAKMSRYEGPLPPGWFHDHEPDSPESRCFNRDIVFDDSCLDKWNTRPNPRSEEMVERVERLTDELLAGWTEQDRDIARAKVRRILSTIPAAMPDEGWLPIESAPKDGTVIDLWGAERDRYENERIASCFWFGDEWKHSSTIYDEETRDGFSPVFNVTHWRPLPHPPVTETEGNGE